MLHISSDGTPAPYPKMLGIGIVLVYHTFTDPDLIRKGAQKEEEYLTKLYKEWSLSTHIYRDLPKAELEKLLSCLSERSDNSMFPTVEEKHKILVITISSHGGEDYILTSDMERICYFDILSYLNTLKWDIPKLIIFNNCRKQPCISQQHWEDGEMILPKDWQNFIILYLCERGTSSFRSTLEGSLCLKELYQFYVSYGDKMDLHSFLEKFISEVRDSITTKQGRPYTQQPILKSCLKELLYFPQIVPSDMTASAPKKVEKVKSSSYPRQAVGTSGEEEMEREEPGGLDIGKT